MMKESRSQGERGKVSEGNEDHGVILVRGRNQDRNNTKKINLLPVIPRSRVLAPLSLKLIYNTKKSLSLRQNRIAPSPPTKKYKTTEGQGRTIFTSRDM